ncbi:hypothetical protein BGZ94_006244 [Podila epigama]|nr:hypothetical protein BGZ94_006244 [Podila epigama]
MRAIVEDMASTVGPSSSRKFCRDYVPDPHLPPTQSRSTSKGITTAASREEIATNLTNHFSQHGKITTMGIYVTYMDQISTRRRNGDP